MSGGPRLDPVGGLIAPGREVALLLDVIRLTTAGPDVEALAGEVSRIITDTTATDVCFVHVLDDGDQSLTLAGATPPFDEQVGRVRLPVGTGISGWVARNRRPVVIAEHKERDGRYVPIPALRGADFTSMASIPMELDPGDLVGVLNVHSVARREFSDRDVELLCGIGRLVAGALHQARLHRRLVGRERGHERFVEQVVATQEAERRRMAADIHDGISQRLISLSYHLDAASNAVGTDGVVTQLEHARGLLSLALDEARAAIGGLRPPILDDLGLSGALASLARSIVPLQIESWVADRRLAEHLEVALYRIAQECLQNVVKHSRASGATVRFEADGDEAELEVSDDGVGFDTAAAAGPAPDGGGYGLRSMAERAELVGGRLRIRSTPGSGTTVTVTVPIRER
ncbi:GAF domain-containing sensor histidine kinase [Pseudonocardia endophytica]|uniref:Oxygen sensor histidine kinase NreB n=1 Tax=Pseudonocardia endophytica TaxID=401976 RepID=A0A4R1I3X5_PSEEN|nr:GAF domain-containing sensor histidine kinase [Pseudonocardia endophytica]TCK27219.1 histidine kinase/DNA gyrase B/HSP90-like ATPase [Pseudonocardia endophytica]